MIDRRAWSEAAQFFGIVAAVFAIGAICGSVVTIVILKAALP